MTKPQRGTPHEMRDDHSLPGTNQAGTGPGDADAPGQGAPPEGEPAPQKEQREDHSLPGTNQAGTGPGAGEPGERG
ncbi:MAG: hypothetical protein R2745_13065 [Vicinamibacterales bacterium]